MMIQVAEDNSWNSCTGLTSDIVERATHELFTTFFGISTTRESENVVAATAHSVQAVCRTSGSWEAEVWVIAPYELSRQLAGMMFDLDIAAVSPDELHDAIGEIANVLAGHLKGQFAGNCNLAPPEIAETPPDLPDGAMSELFWCGDSLLHVAVIGR